MPRRSWHHTLDPESWLDDECIHQVLRSHSLNVPGSASQDNILIVPPSTAHAVCLGSMEDSQGHVADFDLEQRDLVLLPVNDGRRKTADSGSHWTLLMAFKTTGQGGLLRFTCLHLDSLKDSPNMARARRLANRMFHEDMLVESCECAKQVNGYDCGVYLLYFARLLIKARLSVNSWLRVALGMPRKCLGTA